MKIVVIVGGTSNPSNSELLADAFIEGIRTGGAEASKILLREKQINDFTLSHYEPSYTPEPDFAQIQAAIQSADGLVIATPIWNFGIPGNLKNLIDRCGAFALDVETRTKGQWNGKPCYLIYTGGAPRAAWALFRETTSALPTSLQYFGGVHVGTHYEPHAMKRGKAAFGLIVDQRPASLQTMRDQAARFLHLVTSHAETGALPLRFRMKIWFYKTVQSIQRRFF